MNDVHSKYWDGPDEVQALPSQRVDTPLVPRIPGVPQYIPVHPMGLKNRKEVLLVIEMEEREL